MLRGVLNRLLGDRGERAAERALRKSGVRIVGRNVRNRLGELDLIGRDRRDGRIVFCEVKTRTASAGETLPRFGHPAEAVTAAKRRQITRAALAWLKRRDLLGRACRFDVVAVTVRDGRPEVEHFPHAFEATGVSGFYS